MKNTAFLIPLRDVVIFPHVERNLYVGRRMSLAVLKLVAKVPHPEVVFFAQREERIDRPLRKDLYEHGCLARIEAQSKKEEGIVRVTVRGLDRVRMKDLTLEEEGSDIVLKCVYSRVPSVDEPTGAVADRLRRQLLRIIETKRDKSEGPLASKLRSIKSIAELTDQAIDFFSFDIADQQRFLAMTSVLERAQMILEWAHQEDEVRRLERKFREKAEFKNRVHRQDYLKEKAVSIQKKLGETSVEENDSLRMRVEEAGMSEEAHSKCMQEINRLATITPMSPESSVIRSYIEVLLTLPWQQRTEVNLDLEHARQVLDEDHKGLDKVKERIIEYLAVQQLVEHNRGSVLCFLGPPGVGKTSLGQSIARATGRKFVRLSLGGIHDEATIRGHRRTYIASMPGRILKAMSDVKVKNPVFMLDEIEKLDASFSGDPMAAMLEVIDPEQNHQFSDHYAEIEYDLSEVMFIATANTSETMYGALRDRMEFIELPGYTDLEKEEIALEHLIPKQLKANGIPTNSLRFSKPALVEIIRNYTKEAGVRNLERCIAKVCRKVVLEQYMKDDEQDQGTRPGRVTLTKAKAQKLLGVSLNFPVLKRTDKVGIVNGLAIMDDWEGIVHQIDAVRIPGGKGVKKTGNLKPHIGQTIDTAVSILRANPAKFGVNKKFLDENEVHIHYPNIDIAHDGNSNGLALFALLVSVLNDIPVRMDTALTGAINLRGEACAVGGLRTKLVGAWRERIKRVVIPHIQLREISDVPKEIVAELEVIPVRSIDEALRHTLTRLPKDPKSAENLTRLVEVKGTRIGSTRLQH